MINEYNNRQNNQKKKAIKKAEKIYKEIAEDDKRLSEELLSICAKCKT